MGAFLLRARQDVGLTPQAIFWIVLATLLATWPYLFRYLILPLKLRKGRKPISPSYREVQIDQIPAQMAESFAVAAPQLSALGFACIGYVSNYDEQTEQQSYVALWCNASAKDVAEVILVATRSATRGLRYTNLTTFIHSYADGAFIVTSNSTSPSIFPADPRGRAVSCPGIWDLERLYAFHSARIAHASPGQTAAIPAPGEAVKYLAAEYERTFERLVPRYFRIDQEQGEYVKTLYAAYLFAWRLSWPLKQMRLERRRKDAHRELQRMGFGGMAAFEASQKPPDIRPMQVQSVSEPAQASTGGISTE